MKLSRQSIRAAVLVMMLALAACEGDRPQLEIKLKPDYSQIISEIKGVNSALAEKLAAIEKTLSGGFSDNAAALAAIKSAVSSLEGTAAEKLAAIESAVKAQTASLETKLALVEAAVESGFADSAQAQGLIKDAIDALKGSTEEKLAAIESAVKAQTASLESKLALVETAVKEGFADSAAAQGLIKSAIETLKGSTEEKLAAIDAAVKAQTASLETKLGLIEKAVETGFADSAKAQGLIKDAIDALKGSTEEKLAAVESAVKAQTSSLESKLALVEAAVETGFADSAKAQGLIKDAVDALKGSTEDKLAAISKAVTDQSTSLGTKLTAIESALTTGFADSAAAQGLIKSAIETLQGSVEEKLAAISKAVTDQTTSFGTKLTAIEEAINKGFADGAKAQGLIEQAIKTLDSNTAGKLAEILQKITGLPNYSGGLNDIKNAIDTLRKMFVLSVSLDNTALTMYVGTKSALTATVFPDDATDKSVTWKSSDATVAEVSQDGTIAARKPGTATITVTTVIGGNTATCEVTVDYESVDLGLPSGIKWATMNVGATKPEEYGDYFAWGETEPKSYYSWSTYKYANGADNKLTKYCPIGKSNFWGVSGSPDDKIVLEADDDAARANWGSSWRMPTKDRIEELMNNCTVKETTINGISGLNLTGPNGNSIFLPAAGYWNGGSYEDNQNRWGYYLSTSCDTDFPNGAWNLHFSTTTGHHKMHSSQRAYGMQIRPVLAGIKISVTGVKLRPALTLPVGGSATLVASVIPSDADDRTVTWKSSDASAVEVSASGIVTAKKPGGKATITVTTTDGSKTANCDVTVNSVISGHECVDMGIVVGNKIIKWATMNVGANAPEEYGDYFAWGETETKDNYCHDTYKYMNGPNYNYLKYNNNDQLTQLQSDDDVANVKWGKDWRTPTEAELQALIDTKGTADYEWVWCDGNTTEYNNTDVSGWKIERLLTGATLFLPAGGIWNGKSLVGDGNCFYYMSSTLCTDKYHMWCLQFNSLVGVRLNSDDRYFGMSVRPVTE